MTTDEQIAMLEAKTRELVERNRRLANQLRGYSDRVQESIRPLLAGAWDAGARAALLSEDYVVIDHAQVLATNPHRARADKLVTE